MFVCFLVNFMAIEFDSRKNMIKEFCFFVIFFFYYSTKHFTLIVSSSSLSGIVLSPNKCRHQKLTLVIVVLCLI